MTGFMVPDNYVPDLPNDTDMNIASIAWGLSLGITVFNISKAARQTKSAWHRRKRVTAYVALVWVEIISSFLLGVMCWFYLRNKIEPSLEFFFFIIVWWSTQVQCLIQIIINRVSLLMVVRANGTKLKWICFLILLAVNISVFCIWVPARLQISEKYIHLNEIWDRCEKVIFAIMDAALNFYFIYVVKQRLVANGLQKYTRLYQMNLFLVAISIALDILLICMMSLPNSFVYIQFHPLVYLLKLHIEMNMADLIGKVVRASNNQDHDYSSRSRTNGTSRQHPSRFGATIASTHHRTHIELGEEDEFELKEREKIEGIKKTIVTQVTRSGPSENDDDSQGDIDDREISESSSTKQLHQRQYSVE
ncbi:hypothetical protein BHE90_005307 [Fusarium euwallaceae]|uniref:G-protein coupled receptors family 1 profile domain-containing protein n=4 Tax=Fusarium solani species complex TaxID=232080 RepID=A0A3M2RZP3_9HYPO|nr:hypothetical protein CDV36_009633 [Fusarium kuroshium]RSL81779.1 hypothetical protein CEP52_017125 [Fusarium oligoseptatum]RSL94656.1 hypothetical protein CDV31_014209 [Fusarium ambrosium]RTE80203.1 hypothetical protein BHE90_005307 [Fusarium euwallaceae]